MGRRQPYQGLSPQKMIVDNGLDLRSGFGAIKSAAEVWRDGVAGWVLIHRRLLGHRAFRNDGEAMVFAWMILRAAWQPTRVNYKGRLIPLKRGQLAASQRDMARALDRDKSWILRTTKRFENEAMIETSIEAGVSVITICNYDTFQIDPTYGEAVGEAVGEADLNQSRTTEQIRQIKQRNTKYDQFDFAPDGDENGSELGGQYSAPFETWWREYPNKTGKGKAASMYEAAFKKLGGASRGTARVHARLLHALLAQKKLWKRKGVEGKFIPHAATWLNQSRFDDELVVAEMRRAQQQPDVPAAANDEEQFLSPPDPKPQRTARREVQPVGWTP
jgi:hypothetical protein